jgi:hypothetical protein
MVQGVNKEYIFNTDDYMKKYQKLIFSNLKKYNLELLAYCIMNNHAHLLMYTEKIDEIAPVFVAITEADGSVTGELIEGLTVSNDGKKLEGASSSAGKKVLVDYYVVKNSSKVSELQIDAENFAGYYYVEASTLFRDQNTGKDMPAEITLPNVKIQSNFTFSMASTGDPSTFTFTMDAFPGYTYFDNTKKVLCVIQIVEEPDDSSDDVKKSVMKHTAEIQIPENENDSITSSTLTSEIKGESI